MAPYQGVWLLVLLGLRRNLRSSCQVHGSYRLNSNVSNCTSSPAALLTTAVARRKQQRRTHYCSICVGDDEYSSTKETNRNLNAPNVTVGGKYSCRTCFQCQSDSADLLRSRDSSVGELRVFTRIRRAATLSAALFPPLQLEHSCTVL